MKVSALVEVRYFDGRPTSLCARIETPGAPFPLDLPITLEQAALILQTASNQEAEDTEEEEEEQQIPVPSRAKSVSKAVFNTARVVPDSDEDDDDDEDDEL